MKGNSYTQGCAAFWGTSLQDESIFRVLTSGSVSYAALEDKIVKQAVRRSGVWGGIALISFVEAGQFGGLSEAFDCAQFCALSP